MGSRLLVRRETIEMFKGDRPSSGLIDFVNYLRYGQRA